MSDWLSDLEEKKEKKQRERLRTNVKKRVRRKKEKNLCDPFLNDIGKN